MALPTVLENIVKDKRAWLETRKIQQPLADFITNISPSTRQFYQRLQQAETIFILECKKASPSQGTIRKDFNIKDIVTAYQPYASAISVLTDTAYFQGDFEFLRIAAANCSQPILCKDFIIDPYQIYLARYYGADAVLLMLSVLNDADYLSLKALAEKLDMGVLTEASTNTEIQRAIQLNAPVIGINNRNLHDLSIDLNTTRKLAPHIPKDRLIISESGLHHKHELSALRPLVNGFLIGSSLMAQPDLAAALRCLLYGSHKICGLTREEDAKVTEQYATYGGMIFATNSKRKITLPYAKNLMQMAPSLKWVAIFQSQSQQEIITTATQLPELHAIQLHGDESPDFINTLRSHLPPVAIWKALAINEVLPFYDYPVERLVLDAQQGGSGHAFNWQLLNTLPEHYKHQALLAGGISNDNAMKARQLGVYGLDLNSGVEDSPGIKSSTKIQTLFKQFLHH